MLKLAALPLALAAVLSVVTSAQAGGHDRYLAPQSGGTVHNYYGPITIYQGGGAPTYSYGTSAPAQTYSHDQSSYGSATAGAYANSYANAYAGSSGYQSGYGSYGADYGAPWGAPFAGGVGYSRSGNYGGYGYGGGIYGSINGARMDPWNGYYGGRGNGYW